MSIAIWPWWRLSGSVLMWPDFPGRCVTTACFRCGAAGESLNGKRSPPQPKFRARVFGFIMGRASSFKRARKGQGEVQLNGFVLAGVGSGNLFRIEAID